MDTAADSLGYRRYVALGDSYTSGPLIPWQRLDHLGCFRSTNNYPAFLSRRLGLPSYSDMSCAGADTSHMRQSQKIPFGVSPPQFDALRHDTDLVTIGIGGNDFGMFGNLVGTCPMLRSSDPTGTPCRDHFTVDGVDAVRARLPEIQANVTRVLEGIAQRSPKAKVIVVGYPRLVPPHGTCIDVVPLADGDYPWANLIEQGLNRALRHAAETTGATYVDTYRASLRHDACAGGRAWVNGQYTDLFRAASYHPFVSYMAAAASLIYDTLAGVAPSHVRAADAAEVAELELAELEVARLELAPATRVADRARRDDLERAAAELGVHQGSTTPGGFAPR